MDKKFWAWVKRFKKANQGMDSWLLHWKIMELYQRLVVSPRGRRTQPV